MYPSQCRRAFWATAAVTNLLILILLPCLIGDENIFLLFQGLFKPLEKINKLYEFVHQHVTVKSFYLCKYGEITIELKTHVTSVIYFSVTTPPKQILTNKEASLFEVSRNYFQIKSMNWRVNQTLFIAE